MSLAPRRFWRSVILAVDPYFKLCRVLAATCLGLVSLTLLLFVAGLSILAVYAECDPLTLGWVARKDQMLPYFVMDRLGFLVGVPGLFVACLFSGTMRY